MLTVYIVDDEPMAIQYLQYLLAQSGAACEVVGSATNSTRALEEISRREPDVVFTDISMPVMNGLELARRVLERQRARIYLLTSYEDFQYAKQGVKIGVSDYILKNELTQAMLRELLERADAEIAGERRARQLLLERGVRDFLLGASEEAPAFQAPPQTRWALALLLPAWVPMRRGEDAEANSPEGEELRAAADEGEVRCVALARMKRGEYCAILSLPEGATEGKLRAAAGALLSALNAREGGWSCVLAEPCRRVDGLRKAYQAAEAWRDYVYAEPECGIFPASDFTPRRRVNSEESEDYLERVSRLLNAKDREGALSLMEEFLAFGRRNLSAWEYGENARRLYRILGRATLRNAHRAALPNPPEGHIDASALERFLLNCARGYFDELARCDVRSYSPHIQRALEFIRRNYHRELLVTDIADAIGISEGHLRRLFKQELSSSVIDYLTDYRLEQAKLRLEGGEGAPSEIWRACGFSSAPYFNQVFRRREGMSPREYWSRMREEGGA